MERVRRLGIGVVVMCGLMPSLSAQEGPAVPIEERARGAARIVVATVVDTAARYDRNEFGDEVIITRARLSIDEAIKGSVDELTLSLEGGTVDGITMRVSTLPTLVKGERAVFFVVPARGGEFQPHLQGQGILKLDRTDRIRGTSVTLGEIRRLVASADKVRP
jgi:hypothetical protein